MCDAAAKTVDTIPGLVIDKARGILLVEATKRFQIMGVVILYTERFKDQIGIAIAELFFGLLDQFPCN